MAENREFTSTIIIPELFHVNYLAVALAGIIRNSRLRHRIIVVFSDYRRHLLPPSISKKSVNIGHINYPETGEPYQKYESVYDYIKRRGEWCKKHDIEFRNVTEEAIKFQELWLADHPFKNSPIYKELFRYKGGTDAGFKRNLAFRLVDTKWTILSWDDDFYPSQGWDESLFALAEKHADEKAVYVPTHVQLFHFDKIPDWKDYWVESRYDFPSAHSVRLAMPTIRNGGKAYITNDEWNAFVDRWSKKEVLSEPCGLRKLICNLPIMAQTQHLKDIGSSIYPGSYKGAGDGPWSLHGTGGDIELDNRFCREGFIKYSPCDSFILHKGHVAFKSEDV